MSRTTSPSIGLRAPLAPLDAPLEILLTLGGDSRTAVASETLENPYGCSPVPRDEVLELGSCTGSSIGPAGYRAARSALLAARRRVRDGVPLERLLHAGFAAVREELRSTLLGDDAAGVEVVLAPSGTDAELVALALAHGDRSRHLTNVVVGPSEVGSGTPLAASGCYFDRLVPSGAERRVGAPVDEELAQRTRMETVWLRHADGATREETDIDREVIERVERAVGNGDRVLLHLVAHSKTGVHAPSLETVSELARRYPDRVAVMVDAAQGRFSRRGLVEVLGKGFLVLITGSKFYGGPSFSGALLVPEQFDPERRGLPPLDAGMRDFFGAGLLPERWKRFGRRLARADNVGLLLRWEAALGEIRRYYATAPAARLAVLRAYEHLVPEVFARSRHLRLDSVSPPVFADEASRLLESKTTVFTFTVADGEHADTPLGVDALRRIFACLNQDRSSTSAATTAESARTLAARYHIGQPVCLGHDRDTGPWALRVALGGVLLSSIATDPTWGASLDERIAALGGRLEGLRRKLDLLASDPRTIRDAEPLSTG